MNIIGINAYHGDSSACLLVEGRLVAAVEEERFRRIKHWAGFPSKSIEYCLRESNLSLGEIDHVAINRDPKANLIQKISFTFKKRPELSMLLNRAKSARKWASVENELLSSFPGEIFVGKVHHVEHHVAHLSSAFYASPYNESVVVSVDGAGDFVSAAWGVGKGKAIEIEKRIYFPHSLGVYYEALTRFLGFPHYGDEYKVMGLAPYGQLHFMDEMRQIISLQNHGSFTLNLEYFEHHKKKFTNESVGGVPPTSRLYSDALEGLLGAARREGEALEQVHFDIARSAQAMYEEAFFHLLKYLHERFDLDSLALAGGCAMNSVANGKITTETPFKNVYIQSAAGDAGGAIGSALDVWHRLNGEKGEFVMDHAYWGPSFENDQIGKLLAERKGEMEEERCTMELINSESVLCDRTAKAIAGGKVVGWFQGRLEWGPRALGNRSIVCDPRRQDMKQILNAKIKKRESFRPFAPSILREAVSEWFEIDDDVPFMMKVFPIKQEKRAQIPAVTHIDGSGRLQTVCEETNPRYYRLIAAFEQLTGVPIVLNTSFNENEPVVCSPEEALACFLRTNMDVLVLGNHFITRT